MTVNEIFQNAHATRVRELKAEVARLHEELTQARSDLESLRTHFALALVAARDIDNLPAESRLVIIDGWNALLSSSSVLASEERRLHTHAKEEKLYAHVHAWLRTHPCDFAWIVFDGARMGTETQPRLRVTFTGGTGAHRADRLVCDYLRMRRLTGSTRPVLVLTDDKDFRREAASLDASVDNVRCLIEQTATHNSRGA